MSQPSYELAEAPSVLEKKPAITVYTMLSLIALLCMGAAFVFLILELKEYGFNWRSNL